MRLTVNPENEFIINRYRDAIQNTRTRFIRIVLKVRLKPWPQPFHATRKSGQTELADRYPEHVGGGWLGNNELVGGESISRPRMDITAWPSATIRMLS